MSRIVYPFDAPPPEGEATEVAPGVLWCRLPLPMALNHVNVYALDDGDGWTIVDTGFASRKSRAIWGTLLAGPLGGRPVNRVIITHYHPDHIGLAGWFQTEHGADLVTTRTSWVLARMLQLDEQPVPVQQTIDFWRGAGMSAEMLAKRSAERPFNFADSVAPLPLGYTRIQEGETLRAGGRNWIVRVGDGHAPEHATFWSQDDALVLGGDQLLPSISPNLGVYATEPEADPVAEWLESCAYFKTVATDDHFVLPGHKLPFTGLPFRLDQLIDNHHGALDRMRTHLATPHSAVGCFPPLFRRDISDGEFGLALVEAMAHCLFLWHAGEVDRWKDENDVWQWQMRADQR